LSFTKTRMETATLSHMIIWIE